MDIYFYMKKRLVIGIGILALLFGVIFISGCFQLQTEPFPESSAEFEMQGLTWRTMSYYYHPGIYEEQYNPKDNLRFIKKAKNIGADYLFVRVFYNGTEDGKLVGDDVKAEKCLSEAISMAHDYGIKIFLVPYVESRDYWCEKKWNLSEEVWTDVVLKWAGFAEENNVEMFAPGVEMSIIMDGNIAGKWLKEILPQIQEVYNGKIITAEHYDMDRWKILDECGAFAGYDCIGLTVFPRKEYDGVSDIKSLEDYKDYIENEAEVIDMLSEKYDIKCKLAVPMGLDFWQGSYPESPIPSAGDVANASDLGLDILKKHNFTGVFIAHWASEPDHFGKSTEVEQMLGNRWTKDKGV